MAFFQKDSLVLSLVGDDQQVAFVTPDVTPFEDDPDSVTISWYRVANSQAAESPSQFLCPGVQYMIRVGAEGDVDDLVFLGTPTLQDGVTVYPLVATTTSANKALFSAQALSTVSAGSEFNGTLAGLSGSFVLTPNDNWEDVGLTQQLSSTLSNCNSCGCATGQTCQTGICVGSPTVPCPADAICGQQEGRCFGTCASNLGRCVSVDGVYGCVEDEFQGTNWWAYVSAGILAILIAVLLYYFYKIASRYFEAIGLDEDSPDTVETITVQASAVPLNRNSSVALGNDTYF